MGKHRQNVVEDFGAVADGATDDAGAFQRALDALAQEGGTLEIPTGTYRIDSPLRHEGGNLVLELDPAATLDFSQAPVGSTLLTVIGDDRRKAKVSGGKLLGAGSDGEQRALVFDSCSSIRVHGVQISGFTSSGGFSSAADERFDEIRSELDAARESMDRSMERMRRSFGQDGFDDLHDELDDMYDELDEMRDVVSEAHDDAGSGESECDGNWNLVVIGDEESDGSFRMIKRGSSTNSMFKRSSFRIRRN